MKRVLLLLLLKITKIKMETRKKIKRKTQKDLWECIVRILARIVILLKKSKLIRNQAFIGLNLNVLNNLLESFVTLKYKDKE
jgi:hypothetical protein